MKILLSSENPSKKKSLEEALEKLDINNYEIFSFHSLSVKRFI